jgi:hypothetical protein
MWLLCAPRRLGQDAPLAFLFSGAFFNLEKKSCPHAACASVLRACLFSLALFTGKALSAYGRAERSSQGALQVRERRRRNEKKKKTKRKK